MTPERGCAPARPGAGDAPAGAGTAQEEPRPDGAAEAASETAELRRRVEELHQAVRARDDFIAIAAHELRNPMTPIIGLTEAALAAARNAEGVSPRVTTLLEHLQRAARDFIRRATRLLDVGRIESGNLRLEPTEIDLSELVRTVVGRYTVAAAHGRSELELEIEDGVSGVWDRLAAEEIVENLLSNALKFGMGRPVTLRLRSDGRSALLQVQDRGVGMPPDQQARIFGRFEQVVGQHRGGGFGVGLWVASRLVAAMDGRIAVSSRPGEGSTFAVTLPLAPRNRIGRRMPQDEADTGEEEIGRVPSLVPGLDEVLCGGFLRGGLYLVQGPAGIGKTILASQIMYRRAAEGSRALFVTVLGESHGRMLAHLRPMRFFDPSFIPDRVTYLSAYQALEDEGLEGVTTLIRREVLAHKATLLVLDGMSSIEARAGDAFEMKRFTHGLQTLASAAGCTMLLLTTTAGAGSAPEHTMVDGLLELRQRLFGVRGERRLLVHKIRGSGFLEGEHAFRITREGVAVFPRTETLLATPTLRGPPPRARVSSGIASLDAVLRGGIPGATVTAVVGPSGSGKTTLGLQFLSASSAAEPGLLFGCYEPPERLHLKAETMGVELAAAERRGELEILWHPVGEHILDELAQRLLDAVRRRGVRRLLVDGLSGFEQAALEPERLVRFWSALSNELRALGVTTLHTLETPEIMGADLRVPLGGISALADSMVLLRYVELRSRLYRLISLFKVREGAFDPAIREFEITAAGIVVGEPFEGVEAVLSGMARAAAQRGAAGAPPEDGTRALSPDDPGRSG